MRAAALAALVLVLAGCASGSAQTSGSLGVDAAKLVPPDAVVFVNVDTNFDSKQWQVVSGLVGTDLKLEEIKAAAGDGLSLAVLGNGEVVAFAKPHDETKLRDFAQKYGKDYTVERVGAWSVVADSAASFAAVRQASSGSSLADSADFQAASATLTGNSLATAFVNGAGAKHFGALARIVGAAKWYTARVTGESNALRIEVDARSLQPAPTPYRPQLLRDVPSGAVLAVSFKDVGRTLTRIAGKSLGLPLASLAPALRGEGSFYVLPGGLLPIFAFEVQSPDPEAAAAALHAAADKVRVKIGNALPLRVSRYGSRVVLTDAPAASGPTGGSLMDDQPFKDALAAADVPDEVTWLAYADIGRLTPIIQAVTQVLGHGTAKPAQHTALDRLGTVVAFGARDGSTTRLVLRVTTR